MLEVFAAGSELVSADRRGVDNRDDAQPARGATATSGGEGGLGGAAHSEARCALVGRRANVDIDAEFFSELTLVSDVLADAGAINPGNAFAVYRKRT